MSTMRRASVWAILGLLAASWAAAPALAIDKELIDKSVAAGVQVLRRAQQANGKWEHNSNQDVGMTSLAALALLESPVGTDDPQVKLAAQFVRTNAVKETQTYSLALAILFLDRLGEPADEALIEAMTMRLVIGQLRSGGWSYNCPASTMAEQERLNKLVHEGKGRNTTKSGEDKPGEGKRPLKEWTREQQSEMAEMLSKNPQRSGLGDNSNTQFATLGLWISRRNGLPVDGVLAGVEQRFRSTQNDDGGWPYMNEKNSAATMTGAGALCIAIADGTFNSKPDPKAPGRDAKKDANLIRAIQVLSAVIGEPVAKRQDRGLPVAIPQVGGKTFYFLWTLERVCVALDLDMISGKDWYSWGTEIVLANQQLDGSWKGDYGYADICFAILFLRRANLAKDLTTSLKGKMSDLRETTLKGGSSPFKGTALKGIEEKKDAKITTPPTKPLDDKTEKGKIAKEIVQASGAAQARLIAKYRDEKGVTYTEALMTAIPHLNGEEAKRQARDALAQRLGRMKADTLTDYLKDEEPELRRAAALACALKESKSHIPQLIEMLRKEDPEVERAVLAALKDLTKQNFGPSPNATAAERDKAVAAWEEWWKKQQK